VQPYRLKGRFLHLIVSACHALTCLIFVNTGDDIKKLIQAYAPYAISRLGTTGALNQDGTAIYHHRLPGAESFLHQKQEGLCNVMSFADAPHGQTLAHAFIELLPF